MISFADKRRFVYGVDFSGARDAGRRIWIARGVIEEDLLMITGCFQANDLPGSGADREKSLTALRELITKQRHGVFGLDFPFGLPRPLVEQESWEEFVLSFGDIYKGPEEFQRECKSAAGGKELRRVTDLDAKTPLSPYNLRLYRQTYYGIRDVLAPLVKGNMACVLPMHRPLLNRAWLIEICPASTLKQERIGPSYKGTDGKHGAARARILAGIQGGGSLIIREASVRSKILDNPGGDAIDSVVAAFAAFRAFRSGFSVSENSPYTIEGWVYA